MKFIDSNVLIYAVDDTDADMTPNLHNSRTNSALNGVWVTVPRHNCDSVMGGG